MQNIPPGAKGLLVAALVYFAWNPKDREKILEKTKNVWRSPGPIAKEVTDPFKNLILALFEAILALAPYLGVTPQQFFKNITDFKEQVRLLNLEDAGHYS